MSKVHIKRTAQLQDAQQLYDQRTRELRTLRGVRKSHRLTNASASGTYDGSDLAKHATRPGAEDFLKLPSRMGDVLFFRDGSSRQFPLQP